MYNMESDPFSHLTTPAILFITALAFRAVFAFLETSITALRLFKLKELAQKTGRRYKALFQALEKTPHRVLITILIASSFADVTSAALATYIMETIFKHFNLSGGLGFAFGIAIASIAIVIFGEILPKNFAKGRGDRTFQSMLWLTNIIFYTLYPLVTTILRFTDGLLYKFRGKRMFERGSEWISSEREIRFLINYIHEQGILEPEKTEMLQNIFELGHTPIKEIMVPATDVVSVNIQTPINDTLKVFSEHHFTRLPIYENKMDNVVGMVHQKDIFVLLSKHEDKSLKDIIRPIMFVPESMKVNQLLRGFRQKHMHIAIVLNEHGIVTGLITLEDVLEEIVGEISDEHEQTIQKITPLQKSSWLVDASISLEDLSDHLGITFESKDSVSLAVLLTEYLHHLPKKG